MAINITNSHIYFLLLRLRSSFLSVQSMRLCCLTRLSERLQLSLTNNLQLQNVLSIFGERYHLVRKMGIKLTENDMTELEPQISKIFRKQLGFFDSDILSTTMKIIVNGTEKTSLEQSMMSLMETKKAKRAAEEVVTF